MSGRTRVKKKTKKRRGPLSKEEARASTPTASPLTPNKSSPQVNELDADALTFMEECGINQELLTNKKTAKFVLNFIHDKGGIEKVRNSTKRKPNETSHRPVAPSPIYPKQSLPSSSPAVIPTTKPIPPPRPPLPSSSRPSLSIPPPAPPPPPPPPPPPSVAKNTKPIQPNGGGRGALLDSIKTGKTLKPGADGAMTTLPTVKLDPRSELLRQINLGIKLNKADPPSTPKEDVSFDDDFAQSLLEALANKFSPKDGQDYSSSSDDDDDENMGWNTDEWDD